MGNEVDRLFDRVLSSLPSPTDSDVADWPDTPLIDEDHDAIDQPHSFDDTSIVSIFEERNNDRVRDRLTSAVFTPSTSGRDRDLIEGGIRKRGFDTLAFYKSRRFIDHRPFAGKWGIFYFKQSLEYIAGEIMKAYPGYKDPRILAHKFLFSHEFAHYQCDIQSLMLEAALGRHLYIPLRRALRGRRTLFVEEAIANKATYKWSMTPAAGIHEFALDFMSLQPGAYARFMEDRLELNGEWLSNTIDLKPPGSAPRMDIAQWVDATPADLLRPSLCPQYVIYNANLSNWIDPALILPPVIAISENEEVKKRLNGKYRSLESKWNNTKNKLLTERTLNGLGFKPWPKDGKGAYSVKVDGGFRAHLRNLGAGNWLAYIIGSHKELGHG